MKSYKRKIEAMRQLGNRLAILREQLGCTVPEMAARLGLTYNGYYRNETGDTYPGISTMHRLSKEYDISIDWLLFGRGEMYYGDKEGKPEPETGKTPGLAEKTEQGTQRVLKPEVEELVDAMERIPMLYHGVMMNFQKFKMENQELMEKETNY